MKNKLLLMLLCLFILSENNSLNAYPRGSKKCPKKILLPGQDKAIRHNKARKMKNGYF